MLLALTALVSPAEAQSKADARARLQAAKNQVAAGNYDKALVTIATGLQSVPKHLPLLQLRANVLLQKRDYEGALRAFEAFLAAGAKGPNQRKAKRVIANLGAVRTTRLIVTVNRGPARVYLDTKSLGVVCTANPVCDKGMLPGSYRVLVEKPGFEPASAQATLALNAKASIKIELIEKPSPVSLRIVPADAQVSVDGKPLGATKQLAPGTHTIEVRRAGFARHKATVVSAEGKPITIAVALAPVVPVKLTPSGAELELDGKKVVLKDGYVVLPAGSKSAHTLIARAEGYGERSVTIPAQRPDGYKIELVLDKKVVKKPKPLPPLAVKKPRTGRWRRPTGMVLLGLSLVATGVSLYYGNLARGKWDDSKPDCDDNVVCGRTGYDLVIESQSRARKANYWGAGGAFLGLTGLVVWLGKKANDHKGQFGLHIATGAGFRGLATHNDGEYCGELDSDGKPKDICVDTSPLVTDIGISYSFSSRLGVLAEVRLSNQRDFPSTPDGNDGVDQRMYAFGVNINTVDKGVFKVFSTLEFLIDTTKYPSNAKRDYGFKQTNGFMIDVHRNVGAMLYAGEVVTFNRWFRFQGEVGLGLQVRMP